MRILLVLGVLMLSTVTHAAQPSQCGIVQSAPRTTEWSADQVDAFLTDMIDRTMKERGIVGGVATVVKDGVPIYTHAFGQADRKRGINVDANTSLFRIGSITKVITAIAALQQVNEGKLSLDSDISRFPGMERYRGVGGPITLANLLTHTAGFEEAGPDYYSGVKLARRPSFADFLAHTRPQAVYPVGTVRSYSNFGVSLIALMIEQSSTQSFEKYLDARVFGPLNMASSTARTVGSVGSNKHVVTGYAGDAIAPVDYSNAKGTGQVLTTAPDMARFMAALLEGNAAISPRIIGDITAPHFREAPCANALGWILWLENRRGQRLITHGGDVSGGVANMMLFPDHGIGVFYAFNSSDYGAIDAVEDAVIDRWFPRLPLPNNTVARPEAGEYHGTRIGVKNFGRFARLLGDSVADFQYGPNGTLRYKGDLWHQRADGVFESEKGGKTLVTFTRDGRQAYVERGTQSFIKATFFERTDVQLALLALCLVTLFIAALSLRGVRMLSITSLTIALGVLGAIASVGTEQSAWLFGVPVQVRIAVIAAYLLWPLGAAAVVMVIIKVRTEPAPVRRFSLIASGAAALGLAFWFNHWNLIGSAF